MVRSLVRAGLAASGAASGPRRLTAMRFWVRVPVLSEQITVTEPSVSTELRFLIRACLLAMRWDPMARARVTVGSSPSGTLAMMMPMAKRKLFQKPRPMRKPRAKKLRPRVTAMAATIRVTRWISRCRGLKRSFDAAGEVGDLAEFRGHAGGQSHGQPGAVHG